MANKEPRRRIQLSIEKAPFDVKRVFFILLGVGLFAWLYTADPLPDAIDPLGAHFELTREGKAAIALFLLAGTWWVFEVVPIGITSLAIGVVQALFLIRPAKVAFKDFMDPSVLFIFGSLVIGMVFTKVGLTKRLAYKMLTIVGEKTSMIYLGCFVVTAALTHVMAHTAVAATMFPILMAIYTLYGGGEQPTWKGAAHKCHHPLRYGNRLYTSYWHGGFVILDIEDMSRPKLVSHVDWSPPFPWPTHSVIPIPFAINSRRYIIVADEDVARLLTESTRAADDAERFTLDLGRLSDVIHEADHWAAGAGAEAIRAEDIETAIAAAERRAGRVRDLARGSCEAHMAKEAAAWAEKYPEWSA